MSAQITAVPLFDLVVFGGTGDLARRKLMPACTIATGTSSSRPGAASSPSRAPTSTATPTTADRGGRARARARGPPRPACLARFLAASTTSPWMPRASGLDSARGRLLAEKERVRVFNLATAPTCSAGSAPTSADRPDSKSARVVLEKPIGRDLASARAINDQSARCSPRRQIFRIDHYLGKETVQNLMVLRFANSLFEPQWNGSMIDHVQITVAETIGVEGRGAYYDKAGALRDMVQNHILQLLCLVALEPPTSLTAGAVRDEKLKVLRALPPITRNRPRRTRACAASIGPAP